jgi:hypothetical protein
MTGNFRFSDKYFSANGKPPDAYFSWVKPRQRAWWDASNKRKKPGNGANGEDHAAEPESLSLADEIKAAERKHRRRTGNSAGEPPSPLRCGGRYARRGAESPKPGEDPARAKHDTKSDKEAFLRLSKLSRAEYDRVRIKEAEALGIRPATLDKEVGALRPRVEDEAQGSDLVLYAPEPWAYPVDGAELLDEIVTTIRTYPLYQPHFLDVAGANHPIAWCFAEERRGILDSGHHKNGNVGRIVGDELKPKTFSTYCPMVIVAIGSMPVTIENRSLIIGMVRKLPSGPLQPI